MKKGSPSSRIKILPRCFLKLSDTCSLSDILLAAALENLNQLFAQEGISTYLDPCTRRGLKSSKPSSHTGHLRYTLSVPLALFPGCCCCYFLCFSGFTSFPVLSRRLRYGLSFTPRKGWSNSGVGGEIAV